MTKLNEIGLNWLNKNYGDLELFETEKYPNYIFHMKNGKCMLQHNKKNGCVYVNYEEIWSFFESYFGMEYEQIQDLTKVWVEEQYKLGVTTTTATLNTIQKVVEEQYKLGVTTTSNSNQMLMRLVEEQYKLGVTTTQYKDVDGYTMVEEQYKLGVTTTFSTYASFPVQVEEQYKLGVTTTDKYFLRYANEVEEQYKLKN